MNSEPIRTVDQALAFLCEHRFTVKFDQGLRGYREMRFEAVLDSSEQVHTVAIPAGATEETCVWPPLAQSLVSAAETIRKRLERE